MVEPIQRVRVFVLGRGDNPLAAPIDISDPAILQALQLLIDKDAAVPRVTPSATRVLRAAVRTGVANLQRVLGKGLMEMADDGRLLALQKSGKAQAVALASKVR